MTDNEKEMRKELEEKIKQYQYQEQETKKKLERMERDLNKKSKKKGKSLTYILGRFSGGLVLAYAAILAIVAVLALILAIKNYLGALNDNYNPILDVEERYGISLKQITREAIKKEKTIIYKVRPTNWRYRKIEFTVKRTGSKSGASRMTEDDFKEHYLKFIIENMKEEDKYLLEGFEIIDKHNETSRLLEYKLVYNKKENETEEEANNKVQELRSYIFENDENAKSMITNINGLIYQEIVQNEVTSISAMRLAS